MHCAGPNLLGKKMTISPNAKHDSHVLDHGITSVDCLDSESKSNRIAFICDHHITVSGLHVKLYLGSGAHCVI